MFRIHRVSIDNKQLHSMTGSEHYHVKHVANYTFQVVAFFMFNFSFLRVRGRCQRSFISPTSATPVNIAGVLAALFPTTAPSSLPNRTRRACSRFVINPVKFLSASAVLFRAQWPKLRANNLISRTLATINC